MPSEVTLNRLLPDEAAQLLAGVLRAGARDGLSVAAAVVDEAGDLLAFARERDAFPAAINLAIAKAKTAASFRRDTQAMQQQLEQGRSSYLALPDTLPLAGGVPLMFRGRVVGALGISGASSSQDAQLAQAAARQAGLAGDAA